MYKAFIEPDLNTAHLKIYNNFNPFSGFMAPTYILKSARHVTPDQIKSVLKVRLAHMNTMLHIVYCLTLYALDSYCDYVAVCSKASNL